jgi:COMPASS component SWD2
VVSLAMSPMSDAFLSAAEDRTCRLWDLRTPVCSGVMRACDAPVVAWDHQGLVFAVVTDDGVLKMFDAKQYEQGPFITFTLVAPPAPKATARTHRSAALARNAYSSCER